MDKIIAVIVFFFMALVLTAFVVLLTSCFFTDGDFIFVILAVVFGGFAAASVWLGIKMARA